MKVFKKRMNHIGAIFAGVILSSAFIPAVHAEDIEIYTSPAASGTAVNPNIMFIVDTSTSMGTTSKVKDDYDYKTTYKGSCVSTGVYFTDTGKRPNCATSTDYFDISALVCDHAVAGYDATGVKISPPQLGSLYLVGTYSDQFAQFDSGRRWREVDINTTADRSLMVECKSDSGIHGDGTRTYISNGGSGYTNDAPENPDVPHPVWSGGVGNIQLWSGNFINYLTDETVPLVEKTYLEQVQKAVEIMVRGNTRVDIGLMRFDKNNAANGGSVSYPIVNVGADRNDFFSRLATLDANGWTPLSEVYYEALLYYGGKKMDFSQLSNPKNQITTVTEKPGNVEFRSPIVDECDNNYIVLLSDGAPTRDDLNSTRKAVLTGFDAGSCSTDITASSFDDNRDADDSDASTVDNCLDELAEWAYTYDVAEEGTAAHEGKQHILTHTIGFALDPVNHADAIRLMNDTAEKGGGDFYQASTTGELVTIFDEIIAGALKINTTFSSPAVSVNAFNRSTHLDDLYFTLFKPGQSNHWDGNLKKYKLDFKTVDGEQLPYVADKNGDPAVDTTTGFFSDSAQSFWSVDIDGKEVSAGGASSHLGTNRNVYTYTGKYSDSDGVKTPANSTIITGSNKVDNATTALTDTLLDIIGYAEIVPGTSYRETLTNWAKGLDALSEHGDVDTYTDARPVMGDPLHAEPALVQYGQLPSGDPDLVAYVATNDGYLHAFNTDTGEEVFSFIPQEVLPKLQLVMENNSGNKAYALDGNVVAWVNDADGNGTISGASEHVYIYFGMRRGGRNIYAMDVTDRKNPKLLWVIEGGTGDYKELGQTWSSINVEKVKDGSTEKTVLMFGGGYDTAQDGVSIRSADTVGRTVYIADAKTGARLWSAGKDSASPTTGMDYSIPARVKPLDTTGDGFIDRIYAADVGGQIFRFDIDNTNGSGLASSITGAVVIDIADDTEEDTRRIYYPPDVAIVEDERGVRYNAILFSTGFRAHPLNDVVHDRIYMVKDYNTAPIDSDYTLVTEADLYDATLNLAGGEAAADAERDIELSSIAAADGWYISLDDEANPGNWLGEKGLAEPLILEGVAIVTTYTPNMLSSSGSTCGPNPGLGKVYFLDLLDATAAFPSDLDSRSDRHIELTRTGIPPSPNVIITEDGVPTMCVGTECDKTGMAIGARRTYWHEVEQ